MIRHDFGDDPPFFNAIVNPNLNLDANTFALYQQMATTLSAVTDVPNDRLNYYSAVNQPPVYQILGWEGMVSTVQANNGGYLVGVSVVPYLSAEGGAGVVSNSDYLETYQITNGVVQYVGSADPQSLAGQMPVVDIY